MIRVMLLDDHAAFRQSLAFMLNRESDITVVTQVGSLAEARGVKADLDVAVIDLNLPDGNGVDLIRDLRISNSEIAILVLTASSGPKDRARAVEAGAAGVLHKSVSVAEILDAVRRLARGELLIPSQELIDLLRQAGRDREQHQRMELAFNRLTSRERQVLQALAEGLNDKEIGQRLHVSTETVRTHMVHILGKLDATSRLEALVLAVRHGAVLIE
jgi:RNA polymerase sigma factor (sigma-70 family)